MTTTTTAIYYNADGTAELVELDPIDCVFAVIRSLTEDEELAVHAGETEYRVVGHRVVGHRVEVGDGDTFYRLERR